MTYRQDHYSFIQVLFWLFRLRHSCLLCQLFLLTIWKERMRLSWAQSIIWWYNTVSFYRIVSIIYQFFPQTTGVMERRCQP